MRFAAAFLGLVLALFATQPTNADAEIALSRAEAPLNGPWAFRFGDDPRFASAQLDDRAWERVDLTPPPGAHDGDVGLPGYVPGWSARGHAGRWGHAWYRLHVRWSVPVGTTPVLLGPTLVDGAYEIYWNGKRIGGIGDFTATPPRVYAVRPQLFQLGETEASGEGVLAIHVYLPQELADDPEGGGIHVAPILAEPTAGAARHVAQWWKTFWGYVVDLVEPLALLSLALFALSLWRFARSDRFVPFAAASVAAIAASRINQPLFYWTDIESLQTVIIARYVIFNPLAVVLWVIACNRFAGRSDRRIDAAACLLGVVAGIAAYPGFNAQLLQSAARVALLALFGWSVVSVARVAHLRLLALATMLVMAVALFPAELSAIGVQGIWFPYGVGVSRTQYALALVIPLLGLLLHRRVCPAPQKLRHDVDR
ncbi:hypothetical protein [Roseiterribacter gracilis]|uniref:Glycoside hydrolase family 2 n=1 Tax=Roseiterribacter gracilis TaxID=2812848 RepID=A0A8S8XK56_9PROT|nr:hypothetical protein TMPK1_38120 [Rhodospirillales bacterium TMPK1]